MMIRFGGWDRFNGYSVSVEKPIQEGTLTEDGAYPSKGVHYSVSSNGVDIRFKMPHMIMNGHYRAGLRLNRDEIAFLHNSIDDPMS